MRGGAARTVAAVTVAAVLAGTGAAGVPAAGAAADPDAVIRRITVPVEGRSTYGDDFGDPRSGGRTHQGNDLMVAKHRPLQPPRGRLRPRDRGRRDSEGRADRRLRR